MNSGQVEALIKVIGTLTTVDQLWEMKNFLEKFHSDEVRSAMQAVEDRKAQIS